MDGNHELLVGSVGEALRHMASLLEDMTLTQVEQAVVHGERTNEFLVKRPSGTYRVTVEPVGHQVCPVCNDEGGPGPLDPCPKCNKYGPLND